MNSQLASEVRRLGGDPTDEVWRWLLLRGPHGPSFTWSQTRSEPAGHVGVEHLREIIIKQSAEVTDFAAKAALVARQAIKSKDVDIIRRGLQVIGALELVEVIGSVHELSNHAIKEVASDARACLFLLRRAAP